MCRFHLETLFNYFIHQKQLHLPSTSLHLLVPNIFHIIYKIKISIPIYSKIKTSIIQLNTPTYSLSIQQTSYKRHIVYPSTQQFQHVHRSVPPHSPRRLPLDTLLGIIVAIYWRITGDGLTWTRQNIST